jgi:protein TonB
VFASPFEIEDQSFRNRKTSISVLVTVFIHGAILLFLIFSILHTPVPPFEENAGGMSVNFGTDEVGTGNEQPFTYNPSPVATTPAAAASKSEPVASTPENLLTQDNEESAITAPKPDDKPKHKVNKDAVFKPNPKPVTTASNTTKTAKVDNTPPQPTSDPNALFSKGAFGKPNNSKGDGTGGGPGDQGKPNGDPNSKNYLGDGDGNGKGHGVGDLNGGYSLHGRSRLALPSPQQCSNQGKVVIGITVDRSGKVIDTKFRRFESTAFDDCNVNNALMAARKATFNPDPNAPETQQGTITYVYKVH